MFKILNAHVYYGFKDCFCSYVTPNACVITFKVACPSKIIYLLALSLINSNRKKYNEAVIQPHTVQCISCKHLAEPKKEKIT